MKLLETAIAEVKLIVPEVHGDARGFFMEVWHARKFAELGITATFVQDNHSRSRRGTLRGLHYQMARPQGKLVRCIAGEIFDVAVDLRRSSPTFKRWVAERLSADNKRQLWVPEGFAHGFYALSETADVTYKCTAFHTPDLDRSLRWNDPEIAVDWPFPPDEPPTLSDKDAHAPLLGEADLYA